MTTDLFLLSRLPSPSNLKPVFAFISLSSPAPVYFTVYLELPALTDPRARVPRELCEHVYTGASAHSEAISNWHKTDTSLFSSEVWLNEMIVTRHMGDNLGSSSVSLTHRELKLISQLNWEVLEHVFERKHHSPYCKVEVRARKHAISWFDGGNWRLDVHTHLVIANAARH